MAWRAVGEGKHGRREGQMEIRVRWVGGRGKVERGKKDGMEGREGQRKEVGLTLELLSALISSELVSEDDLKRASRQMISSCDLSGRERGKEAGEERKGKLTSEGCRPITRRFTADFRRAPAKMRTKLVPSPFCRCREQASARSGRGKRGEG